MEMVVTLFILVLVLVGVLELFDLSSKVSRVQVDSADMQQTVRSAQYDMVRMLRMAGRGMVPAQSPQPAAPPWTWSHPNGIAVAVQNNVPASTYVDDPATNNPILEGTDVLTIRGVLTTPVYMADPASWAVIGTDPTAGGGTFTVSNLTPEGNLPQDLRALADAIQGGRPEALVMVSPDDDGVRHIARLDPAGSVVTIVGGQITQVTVSFRLGPQSEDYARSYWELSGSQWNPGLTKGMAYVGIIEEYRYYVADEREIPADATSPPKPRLMRARVYPGTALPWGPGPGAAINNLANWAVPMADNVTDLQVALGIDIGVGSPFTITDSGDNNDEWLFNSDTDDPTKPPAVGGLSLWQTNGRLRYVRLSTTAFAERRDQTYEAPGYDSPDKPGTVADVRVEDHLYQVPEFDTASAIVPDRMFRRRSIRTLVDLRNL